MRIDRVRVEVAGPIEATALAAAIRRRVGGDTWPAGPERHVADAVLAARDEAVRADEQGAGRWR